MIDFSSAIVPLLADRLEARLLLIFGFRLCLPLLNLLGLHFPTFGSAAGD